MVGFTKWRSIYVLGLVLFLGACASSQKQEENTDAIPPADVTGNLPPEQGKEAPKAVEDSTKAVVGQPAGSTAKEDKKAQSEKEKGTEAGSLIAKDNATSPTSYTVKKGDTLMKIAFELYGNLYKWKQIYENNKDKISDPNTITRGMVLQIEGAGGVEELSGEKYLIQTGDTLGSISNTVYKTPSRWRELYEKNKAQIQNPNRIFAGFYLYYDLGDGAKPLAKNAKTPEIPSGLMSSTTATALPVAQTPIAANTPVPVDPVKAPDPAPAVDPSLPPSSSAEAPSDASLPPSSSAEAPSDASLPPPSSAEAPAPALAVDPGIPAELQGAAGSDAPPPDLSKAE